ncbi:MAG TPA: DUF58 domain-containing protein, partial [Acidimicrobiia bacterium]|nr:DUF58 domain-containing protein [Acidimicrobiia bacterium]
MSPTARAAAMLGAIALLALALPPAVTSVAVVVFAAALVTDTLLARRPLKLRRTVPTVLARGVPASLRVDALPEGRGRVEVRQPRVPDIDIEPATARSALDSTVIARRRGQHVLPAVAARRDGPLGLGSWYFRGDARAEIVVYPDVPAARRLALAVRRGRFRAPGRHTRGPLGLGTEFETIRDYRPDDDVRQINWRATARTGRPMSNQYRIEQDRDVVCLVDAGRLMAAPLADRTRLDAALDAVTAVAFAADELGDRSGVLAFDREVLRDVPPRRRGGERVLRAIYDLEPRSTDSDYDLAFRRVGGGKRSLVLVLTDLLDEAAGRALLDAVPVVARRHAVVVASVRDPDLDAALAAVPRVPHDVYRTVVALDVVDARARVATALRRAGAEVLEAPPATFTEAC